jgi:hypothetical protein
VVSTWSRIKQTSKGSNQSKALQPKQINDYEDSLYFKIMFDFFDKEVI